MKILAYYSNKTIDLSIKSLELFSKIAYCIAKHNDINPIEILKISHEKRKEKFVDTYVENIDIVCNPRDKGFVVLYPIASFT